VEGDQRQSEPGSGNATHADDAEADVDGLEMPLPASPMVMADADGDLFASAASSPGELDGSGGGEGSSSGGGNGSRGGSGVAGQGASRMMASDVMAAEAARCRMFWGGTGSGGSGGGAGGGGSRGGGGSGGGTVGGGGSGVGEITPALDLIRKRLFTGRAHFAGDSDLSPVIQQRVLQELDAHWWSQ